LQYYIY